MSLSDIKRKLYEKKEDKDLAVHADTVFNPEKSSAIWENENNKEKREVWSGGEIEAELSEKKQKSIRTGAIAFGIIIFIIAAIIGIYIYKRTSFNEVNVTTEITGPVDAGSGKLLTYNIDYKNNNRADLSNVTLKAIFPENFKPEDNAGFVSDGPTTGHWDIKKIAGHAGGKITLNGRVYSPQGALVYIKITTPLKE